MSLGFLIPMYPDELFSGYLMRLYKVSPYIYPKSFAGEVFASKKQKINYLYLNNLNASFSKQINEKFGLKSIIESHTLSGFNNLFGEFKGKNESSRFLRYCPLCGQYFQVLPQVEGLTHCPIHETRFINSDISLDRKTNYLIKPFPLLKNDCAETSDSGSLSVKLSKYIYDILKVAKNDSKPAPIAHFLREHIPNKYKISNSGIQIKLEALKKELDKCYKALKTYSLSKRQLGRILNGESFNPFEICLIGFFLKISPEEMVNRKIKQHKSLETKVVKLKIKGLSERAIAKRLNISKTLVHKTIIGGKTK